MPVPTEQLFSILIGGKRYDEYVFTDFVLTKELLKPNELKFAMRKKSVLKNDQDVAFAISNELLGASVKLQVKTNRRDQSQDICSGDREEYKVHRRLYPLYKGADRAKEH